MATHVSLKSEDRRGEATKERLLDTTERLVAERGFDGVSLRDITNGAGVNVAAVNYHYGSKENLYEAVQSRYLLPVNEERFERLERVELEGGGVRDVLEAFMRPLLTMVTRSKLSEQLFFKLVGRCVLDQNMRMSGEMTESFQRVAERFVAALSLRLPDLSQEELLWRLHFASGVVDQTLLFGDMLKQVTEGASGDPDYELSLARMIDFCHAGLKAGGGESKREGGCL